MTALAVLPSDVESADALVARFAEFERGLRSELDVDKLVDAVQSARLLKAAIEIRKMAARVHRAAFRLQAVALRRLAQIDAPLASYENKMQRASARYMAEANDEEFERFLGREDLHGIGMLGRAIRDAHRTERLRDAIAKNDPDVTQPSRDLHRRANYLHAASILLDDLMSSESFTVADAADELLDRMGVFGDDLARIAAREVVREALNATEYAAAAPSGPPEMPDFVTIHADAQDIWLRIPITKATLDQLRWMAEYRADQAAEVAKAARRLEAAVKMCEAVRDREAPDCADADFLCSWTWLGVPAEAVAS